MLNRTECIYKYLLINFVHLKNLYTYTNHMDASGAEAILMKLYLYSVLEV